MYAQEDIAYTLHMYDMYVDIVYIYIYIDIVYIYRDYHIIYIIILYL